jgi:hypothetical protein
MQREAKDIIIVVVVVVVTREGELEKFTVPKFPRQCPLVRLYKCAVDKSAA